jgi:acetyltransferase-like isoleucine patch superfamily enzyme
MMHSVNLFHVLNIFKSCLLVVIYKIYARYIGKKVRIYSPLKIDGLKNISIEKNVTIQYKTWLAAVPHTGSDTCHLYIGEGSVIGHFNHIYCTKSIHIGKYVLTADKVYISDNLHGYSDVTVPILKQPIVQRGEVEIGDGSWLGENVCVLGAKIGRNCVIGANSVVTHDIPDYCVAVGAPAKIIKKYNHEERIWEEI